VNKFLLHAFVFILSAITIEPIWAAERRKSKIPLQLESLIVDVNGERRRVEPRSGISVVRGDLITFVDVLISPQTKKPPVVDVDGFSSADDQGKVIDTATDLDSSSSKGGKGRQFRVRVLGGNNVYGTTFLNIVEPELVAFEVELNGMRRLLKSGDRLALSPSDELRVMAVRTNVRGNENVKHDLVTKDRSKGVTRKEIRFTRGPKVFARIPIDWKGS
jgi:hypothetical protein